jgi:hypothetical protein
MSTPLPLRAILLAAGVFLACAPTHAQNPAPPQASAAATDNPAPCTVAPQPKPCGATSSTPATPRATEKFPFPGDPSAPAPNPSAKKSTQDAFPFPGEDPATPLTPSPADSSSSSSSAGDVPDPSATPDPTAAIPGQPALDDKGSDGTAQPPGRHILHRVNPIGTKLQSPDEREAEDIDIAHFYTQTGDLQGAYLRSQDAVKTAPDDPDAHFALAEAARRLNKRDEAIAEYNACLKLDPDPKKAAAAHKALARLNGAGK